MSPATRSTQPLAEQVQSGARPIAWSLDTRTNFDKKAGRWKVERLFAWLHNYRRLVTRWEYHIENFLGFVHLACFKLLLRYL